MEHVRFYQMVPHLNIPLTYWTSRSHLHDITVTTIYTCTYMATLTQLLLLH